MEEMGRCWYKGYKVSDVQNELNSGDLYSMENIVNNTNFIYLKLLRGRTELLLEHTHTNANYMK